MLRILSLGTLVLVLGLGVPGCQQAEETPEAGETPESGQDQGEEQIAVIRVKDLGELRFRFLPEKAPQHVENFKKLAREGFYNGCTFHRVIPKFMIQGGDPLSKDDNPDNDGQGGPGHIVPAEFNDVPHQRGIVSMARRRDPDSAGSQFFIMVADSPAWSRTLDGKYTVFGEVISGMEVADKIAAVPRDRRERPLEGVIMESVTLEPAE